MEKIVTQRRKGNILFHIESKQYMLCGIDVIHLYKKDDESWTIHERFTEDNIEIAIKVYIKDCKLKGELHDITLFMEDGTHLAHADNYNKECDNFVFDKIVFKL